MKRALKFDSMESAIFSYFFLNDILLGQVLVDDAIAVERIKLANTLNDFQQKEKTNCLHNSSLG
jgi:hypothetical protein